MSSATSRPLLCLHVGQAGIQIGHAAWELMCLEHNIRLDGEPKRECGDFGNIDTMFMETSQGHFIPRSIFVDTDPFCVDEVRSGPYRSLFSSHQLLSDQVDSGTNYATGRYGYSKSLLPDATERLRWLAEKSDIAPTICLFHSACGGTGSGFLVACLTQAQDELGLNGRGTMDMCAVPGRMAAQNCCELFNTALYLEESQDLVRQTLCVSNSALFRICSSQLQSNGRATYAHVNRILATAFSNLTATERLPGSSVSLYTILDSVMPFEHLKYPILACAPFLTAEAARVDKPTARSITSSVLEPGSQFLDVDQRKGRHVAGYLLYRGSTTAGEVQQLVQEVTLKGRVEFHDWAPAGFRTGQVALPPLAPQLSGMQSPTLSVTMVSCHSGIAAVFQGLARAARHLLESDLFVHSYEVAIVAMLGPHHLHPVGSASNADQPGPSSLSHWMSPITSAPSSVTSAQFEALKQQQLGRRTQASDQLRTGALSDVFGVRGRLNGAVDYLEQVANVYSADDGEIAFGLQPQPGDDQEQSDEESAILIISDARLSDVIASRELLGLQEASTETNDPPSRDDQDSEMTTQGLAGSVEVNGSSSGEGEGADSDLQSAEEAGSGSQGLVTAEPSPEGQQLQLHQQSAQSNCPMTMSSPEFTSSSAQSPALSSRRGQIGKSIRRAALQLGCLRTRTKSADKSRKSADAATDHELLAWSARPSESGNNSECQTVIADAQRFLMKYRR